MATAGKELKIETQVEVGTLVRNPCNLKIYHCFICVFFQLRGVYGGRPH